MASHFSAEKTCPDFDKVRVAELSLQSHCVDLVGTQWIILLFVWQHKLRGSGFLLLPNIAPRVLVTNPS